MGGAPSRWETMSYRDGTAQLLELVESTAQLAKRGGRAERPHTNYERRRLEQVAAILRSAERALRILKEHGSDFSRALRVLRRHLVAHSCYQAQTWRLSAIASAEPAELESFLVVNGLEAIKALQAEGRGVILVNSHFGGGLAVPLWLARQGYKVYSIHREAVFERLKVTPPENLTLRMLDDSFSAQLLFEGQRVLRKGGIVHLAADGYVGTTGLELPFRGRLRHFKGGFAGLALEAKVPAFPVFAPFDETGKLHFDFEAPLDAGSAELDPNARIRIQIEDYVQRLDERWHKDAGNVLDRHLKKFVQLPKVAP